MCIFLAITVSNLHMITDFTVQLCDNFGFGLIIRIRANKTRQMYYTCSLVKQNEIAINVLCCHKRGIN